MAPALSYDILFQISRFLPDGPRLELSLMNKDTFHLMHPAHLRRNFIDSINIILERCHAYKYDYRDDESIFDDEVRMNRFWASQHSVLHHAINTPGALLNELLDIVGRDEKIIDLENLRGDVEISKHLGRQDDSDPSILPAINDGNFIILRTWTEMFLDEVIDICRRADNAAALETLESRIPPIRERLALLKQQHLSKALKCGQAEFIKFLIRGGYCDLNTFAIESESHIMTKHAGKLLQTLVDLDATPFFFAQDGDGLDLLHRGTLSGQVTEEALRVLVENGDMERLTRGNFRIQGGRILYLGDPGTGGVPEQLPTRCTALDLAVQNTNVTTMENLLSVGANIGGSFEIYQEERERAGSTYIKTWNPTSPLHEMFEQPRGDWGNNPMFNLDIIWEPHVGEAYYVRLINRQVIPQTGRQVCQYQFCLRDTEDSDFDIHRGGILQNLVGYAEYVHEGLQLLLQHGAGRYVNTSLPGRGTPLERFLVLAQKFLKRHRFLLGHRGIGKYADIHEGCPLLDTFADGTRLLDSLGETCDLLFDAGAHYEGYQGEENVTGPDRLLRLLRLHSGLSFTVDKFKRQMDKLRMKIRE